MTEEQIEQLGRRYDLSVPSEYRRLILNQPHLTGELADVYENELIIDHSVLIKINEEVRSGETPGLPTWPPGYLVIGVSGCGDYYCLDTQRSPAPVICWNHEVGQFETAAASAERFVAAMLENP